MYVLVPMPYLFFGASADSSAYGSSLASGWATHAFELHGILLCKEIKEADRLDAVLKWGFLINWIENLTDYIFKYPFPVSLGFNRRAAPVVSCTACKYYFWHASCGNTVLQPTGFLTRFEMYGTRSMQVDRRRQISDRFLCNRQRRNPGHIVPCTGRYRPFQSILKSKFEHESIRCRVCRVHSSVQPALELHDVAVLSWSCVNKHSAQYKKPFRATVMCHAENWGWSSGDGVSCSHSPRCHHCGVWLLLKSGLGQLLLLKTSQRREIII